MRSSEKKKQKLLNQAAALLNQNNLSEVKPLLDRLMKDDSENMEIHYLFGIYYTRRENYRSAIAHLLRVIDSSVSTIYMPQAVKILVFAYIKTKNFNIAKSLIQDALEKYYDDLQLKNMQASIYYQEGNYRECLQIFRDILKKEPRNLTALNGIGYCLIEHLSRYEEGLKFCLQAAEKSPTDPAILDSVGWGYFKLGKYQEAEYYLKQAFEIWPENEVIKKHMTIAVEAG